MGYVVEQISRAGRHIEYTKIDQPSCNIGRGFNNHLILDDPYMDAEHITITNSLDGLSVTVLSADGHTSIDGKTISPSTVSIQSGAELVLGKTHLRIYATDHEVAPIRSFQAVDQLLNQFGNAKFALTITFLYLLVAGVDDYFHSTVKFEFSGWLVGLLSLLLGAGLWVGFSALLTRIVRSETRFWQHWVVVVLFLSFTSLYAPLNNFLTFNFGTNWLLSSLDYFVLGVTVAIMLWFQLRIALRQTNWIRLLVANSIAWGFVAYGVLTTYSFQREFEPSPNYESTLLPRALLLRTPIQQEQFLLDADELFKFPDEEDDHGAAE